MTTVTSHRYPSASVSATRWRAGDIPRLAYTARILILCFVPIVTVVLSNFTFLFVPQVQEALLAFDDGPGLRWRLTSQAFSFEVAYVMWLVSAWYVPHLLIGKRFEPDLVAGCASPKFARGVAKHLPRQLALYSGLPIALLLLQRPRTLGLGALSLFFCALVFIYLVLRRDLSMYARWGLKGGSTWLKHWTRRDFEDIDRFDTLSVGARVFIAILFATSFGLWLALPIFMTPLARWIGTPALLLFALMSWTIFGGLVLTYFPKSTGMPTLYGIAVLALFLSFRWNENHPVAPPVPDINNAARMELSSAFVDWLHHRANQQDPVIFVASSGGASRAAYWTTSSLGMLEDEARSSGHRFAENIFVISGISGGSLGAASFVASLDLVRRSNSAPCSSVRAMANGLTGRDDLSTVAGLLLFPDLLQRFLPLPVAAWDRSRGLEETWARDWNEIIRNCASKTPLTNPWNREFTSLYTPNGGGPPLPALVLSSTAVGSGEVVLQSSFRIELLNTFDILDPKLQTRSLTLAQAVHNSARFPYISPAGVVRLAGGRAWDRIVEGGYVERSGTLALSQILSQLIRNNLIRSAGPSGGNCDNHACYILFDQIRVLILDSIPTYGGNLLCGAPLPGSSGDRRPQAGNFWFPATTPAPPGPDFLAPLATALATGGGRAGSAEVDLQSMAGGCTRHFAELRLPAASAGEQDPSMNWRLNTVSRSQIDTVLDGRDETSRHQQIADPKILLQQNLAIVRSWFAN